MRDKTVEDAMTPLESVYMLDISTYINRKTLKEVVILFTPQMHKVIYSCQGISPAHNVQLVHRGHSRVPIYQGSKNNICGILLVKRLIGLDPDDATPVSTLQGAQTPPPSCLTTTPLYDLLNIFQTGKSKIK